MFKRAVHPGTILKDELDELSITPTEFARQIDVPPNRVSQIISGKRSITGDTALRFGHWFGVDPEFWINLQAQFELATADKETGEAIRKLPTKASLPFQQTMSASNARTSLWSDMEWMSAMLFANFRLSGK